MHANERQTDGQRFFVSYLDYYQKSVQNHITGKKKKNVFIHFFSHLEKDREETDLDETLNYSAEVCSIFSL